MRTNRAPKADLHLHTTASDGVMTPTEVVEAAADAGLAAIAISDHDTVAGIEEATVAGRSLGVEVVPAIEINTEIGPLDVHILGYFVDCSSAKFLKELDTLASARVKRAEKIVQKLNMVGVAVKLDRVMELAQSGTVGRPHVAHAIVEQGYADSVAKAFSSFLVRGAPAYVERSKLTPYDAVRIVLEAGGVAGLAHPLQVGRDDIIPLLYKHGLGALEVYYSGQDTGKYQAFARKYNLIATGGSDAHGFDGTEPIGSVTVDASIVDQLRNAAQSMASTN